MPAPTTKNMSAPPAPIEAEKKVDPASTTASIPHQEKKEQKEEGGLENDSNEVDDTLIDATLFRLTAGIPKRELQLMIDEFNECEALLQAEIKALEQALVVAPPKIESKEEKEETSMRTTEDTDDVILTTMTPEVEAMLESPLTALDRFWTASALLGRLRGQLGLPSLLGANTQADTPGTRDEARALLFREPPIMAHTYVESPIPVDTLSAVWKKIFSNRFAWVFKKPVRDEEAPGYSERIVFPMDLSLVRKRIVVKNIHSFRDLHESIALIAHNCVKYNGRETDYGKVARDFEVMADQMILQAVTQYQNQSRTTATEASTTKTSTAAATSSSAAGANTTTTMTTTTIATAPSTTAPSTEITATKGTSDGNARQTTEGKPDSSTQQEGAPSSVADPSAAESAPAKAAEPPKSK
jgi:hypothetical protein